MGTLCEDVTGPLLDGLWNMVSRLGCLASPPKAYVALITQG